MKLRAALSVVSLTATAFFITPLRADSTVVFNEIMYHPAASEAQLEWFELHNQMAVDMDISDWFLSAGVFYRFPEGTIVPGGGYLVVAISPGALEQSTGYPGALGPYVGRLDNSGERLELSNNNGRVMDRLRYRVGGRWPVKADGSGVSLAKVGRQTASAAAENWAPSLQVGGTPGRANFPADTGDEGPVTREDGLVSYWSFDEMSGPALDLADGNDGNLGAGVARVAGLIGDGAVSFDNTTDALVNVGSGTGDNFSTTSGITVEALIVPEWSGDPGDYDEIFRKEDGSRRILFGFQNDGLAGTRDVPITPVEQPVLSFGISVGGAYSELDMPLDGQAGRPALSDLEDGGPHHVAATYDRSTGLKAIYLDGELAFSATLTPGSSISSGGIATAYIGNMSGRRQPFTGVIDEVAFWNRALGAADIARHFASFQAGSSYFSSPDPVDPTAVSLAFNETSISTVVEESWLEVVNAGDSSLQVANLVLASQGSVVAEYIFPALTLEANAYLVLTEADLGFNLIADNRLFLYTPERSSVPDGVRLKSGLRGRSPEAVGRWLIPDAPTPGMENSFTFHDELVINEIMYHPRAEPATPPSFEEIPLVDIDAVWKYEASGADLGGAWRQRVFDDDAWSSGASLLYNESAALPAPKNTLIPLGAITFYFRTEFDFTGEPREVQLRLHPIVDDGAVFYLNGAEIFRLRMAGGPVSSSTTASEAVADADFSGPFTLPADSLLSGNNVLAVEVHQRSSNSSDVVFGLELAAATSLSGGQGAQESPEAWVEIYNRSDSPVLLDGWRLDEGIRYDFAPGTAIGAGEYLVVAGDRMFLQGLHPDLRILGDFLGRLSHRSDLIVLEDATGNPVDEVRYHDDGRWHEYADGGGSSLERRDVQAEGSRAAAWAASDEGTKSAWRIYTYRERAVVNIGPSRWSEFVLGLLDAGEVLIDDLSVVESPEGAARQLIQNGDFESGASAWRLLGNHGHSRVIVDPDDPGNRVLHLLATGPTEHMHNHLETTLAGGASVRNGRIYEVSYRARWLAGSNQLNTRLYFNRVPETTLLEVPGFGGTPGRQNSTFEANIGPTFSRLAHEPVVPAAGEAVRVSVSIEDPDGVATARLRYSVNGGGWLARDLDPGADGLHRGTIPGQSSSRTVQFYVEATDALGATATFPAAGRNSRALYRVNDGRARLGTVHNFRIIMTPADIDLLHENTNLMSNDRLGASVVYDEKEVFYDVGVRLRGSERGRPETNRVSFNVRFQPDRLFRGVHRTATIDRSGGWSSMVPFGSQDEILVKHIVNHAGGIPGMYDDIVRVIAPRPAHTGSALLLMAKFGDVFLDSQWENGGDGTAFEFELIYYPTTTDGAGFKRPQPDQVLGTDIADHGDDKEVYRWNFLIKNNRDRDDYSALIALCKSFSLPASQLEAGTREVMDVDEWMRTFAMYSLCGIGDTYTFGNNHNNMHYVRPDDRKVLVLPWDMDFAFVRSTSASLWGDQNLRRVIELPANTRRFYAHLQDIIETTYNRTYMSHWTTHYGNLSGASFAGILNYIGQRANFVRGRLPSPVDFEIVTNGGRDFSVDAPSVTLEGNAGIDVQSILLSGGEAPPVSWSSLSRWRATIPLLSGANELTFYGFDIRGDLNSTARITVTSTFGLPAPFLTAVEPSAAMPGETVTVRGTGFHDSTEVFFGETPAAFVDFDEARDPASLTAEVPFLPAGDVAITATNFGSPPSNALDFTVLPLPPRFVRGDLNLDGVIDISDAIRILLYLFRGLPTTCRDAGDADDNEVLDVTDAIVVLSFLFQGGPPPAAPYPQPGEDPTNGGPLDCTEGIPLP